jgi:UDP-N-acetylglucosamine acyltransferase
MIHPTAYVHPEAVLGVGVSVGEFCVVDAGAKLGDGCRLAAHAVVRAGCEVGNGVFIDSFAVVGGDSQMRSPDPAAAAGLVRIGARCVLREGVTVNRPAKPGGVTEIGEDCFLMANSHVGHDSRLGDFVTLANNVMLAGHVVIGAHTFIGGGAGVHQFVRVGEGAMIGGNAAISYDVPPFTIAADRNDVCGLNLVGLRRRGTPSEVLADLKACFRGVLFGDGDPRLAAQAAIGAGHPGTTPTGREFLDFFVGGKRGFCRARSRHGRERGAAAAD